MFCPACGEGPRCFFLLEGETLPQAKIVLFPQRDASAPREIPLDHCPKTVGWIDVR